VVAVVLGHDPHRRGVVVHHEHAAAPQGHEREAAVARGARADRRVVRSEVRVLARGAARRGAGGQVERRVVLQGEDVVLVVGRDPVQLLAVLVGDDQVLLVGRGPGRVRLRADVDAVERLALFRVEEGDVAARDVGDHRVRVAAGPVVVAAVEDEHVRPGRRGPGLLLAAPADGKAEVDRLGLGGRGVVRQLLAIVDVKRADSGVEPVFLVDKPDLVGAVATVIVVGVGSGGAGHCNSGKRDEGHQAHQQQALPHTYSPCASFG
jgi:hypothetical protein